MKIDRRSNPMPRIYLRDDLDAVPSLLYQKLPAAVLRHTHTVKGCSCAFRNPPAAIQTGRNPRQPKEKIG